MEGHAAASDSAVDICSIILSASAGDDRVDLVDAIEQMQRAVGSTGVADEAATFDLSSPSRSEAALSPSPVVAQGRRRQAWTAKPQEYLRAAAWQSLAEAHEDHRQLRSTLQRAGKLCSGPAGSVLSGSPATRNFEYYPGTSDLFEAANEMPEWACSSLPEGADEMPDSIRSELREAMSDAVNTIGGQVASIRSAMQDALLEHSSAHCKAVHDVGSDFARMSIDVKEMRAVMSSMRSVILEAFGEVVQEIREAVPATVADLKEEIGAMRLTMSKTLEQHRDLHGQSRDKEAEESKHAVSLLSLTGSLLEIADIAQDVHEEAHAASRRELPDAHSNLTHEVALQVEPQTTAPCHSICTSEDESDAGERGAAHRSVMSQELVNLRELMLEVLAQQKAQHTELVIDLREGSGLSHSISADLRAAFLALETLSQHTVEQHMLLRQIQQDFACRQTAQEGPSWEMQLVATRELSSGPPEASGAVPSTPGSLAVDEVECPEATPFEEQAEGASHVVHSQQRNARHSAGQWSQSRTDERAQTPISTPAEMIEFCSSVLDALAQQSKALESIAAKFLPELPNELSNSVVLDALAQQLEAIEDVRERFSTAIPGEAPVMQKLVGIHSAVVRMQAQQNCELEDLRGKLLLELQGGLSLIRNQIDEHFTMPESPISKNDVFEDLCESSSSRRPMGADDHSDLFQEIARLSRYQDELIQDLQQERPEVMATVKTEVNRVLFEQLRDVRSDVSRDVRSEIGEGVAKISSMVLEAISHLTALQEEVMQAVQPEQTGVVPVVREALAEFQVTLQERLSHHKQAQQQFHNMMQQAELHRDSNSAVISELAGYHLKLSSALAHDRTSQEKVQNDFRTELQEVLVRTRSTLLEEFMKQQAQLDRSSSELHQSHQSALGIIRREMADLQSGLLQEFFKHHSAQDEFLRGLRQEREESAVSTKEQLQGMRSSIVHESIGHQRLVQNDIGRELIALREMLEALVRQQVHSPEAMNSTEARQQDKESMQPTELVIKDVSESIGRACTVALTEEMANLRAAVLEVLQEQHQATPSVTPADAHFSDAVESIRAEMIGMRSSMLEPLAELKSTLEDVSNSVHQEEREGGPSTLNSESAKRVLQECLQDVRPGERRESFELSMQAVATSGDEQSLSQVLQILKAEQSATQRITQEMVDMRSTVLEALGSIAAVVREELQGIRSTVQATNPHHHRHKEKSEIAEALKNTEAMKCELFEKHEALCEQVASESNKVIRQTQTTIEELRSMNAVVMEAFGQQRKAFEGTSLGISADLVDMRAAIIDKLREQEQLLYRFCSDTGQQPADLHALTHMDLREMHSAIKEAMLEIKSSPDADVQKERMARHEEVQASLREELMQQRKILEAISSATCTDQPSMQSSLLQLQDLLAGLRSNPVKQAAEDEGVQEGAHRKDETDTRELQPELGPQLQEELAQQRQIMQTICSSVREDVATMRSEVLERVGHALQQQELLIRSVVCEDLSKMRGELLQKVDHLLQQPASLQGVLQNEYQEMRSWLLEAVAELKARLDTGMQKVEQCPESIVELQREVERVRSTVSMAISQQNTLLEEIPSSLRRECSEVSSAITDEFAGMRIMFRETLPQLEAAEKRIPDLSKEDASPRSLQGQEVDTHFEEIKRMCHAMAQGQEMDLHFEEIKRMCNAVLETNVQQKTLLEDVPSSFRNECSEVTSAIKDEVLQDLQTQGLTLDAVLNKLEKTNEEVKHTHSALSHHVKTVGKEITDELSALRSDVFHKMLSSQEHLIDKLSKPSPEVEGSTHRELKSMHSGMLEAVTKVGDCPETLARLEQEVETTRSTILEALTHQNSVLEAVPSVLRKECGDIATCPETLDRLEQEISSFRSALLQALAEQSTTLEDVLRNQCSETSSTIKKHMERFMANMSAEQVNDAVQSQTGPKGKSNAFARSLSEKFEAAAQKVEGDRSSTAPDIAGLQSTILEALAQQSSTLEASLKRECIDLASAIESFRQEYSEMSSILRDDVRSSRLIPPNIQVSSNVEDDVGSAPTAVQNRPVGRLLPPNIEGAAQAEVKPVRARARSSFVFVDGPKSLNVDVKGVEKRVQIVEDRVEDEVEEQEDKEEESSESIARLESEMAGMRSAVLEAIAQHSTRLEASVGRECSEASSAIMGELASVRDMVECLQLHEAPEADQASKNMDDTFGRIKADIHSCLQEALAEQQIVLSRACEDIGNMKDSEGTRHTEALCMMNEDFCRMHSAVLHKLDQQMIVLDSFNTDAHGGTSDSVKKIGVELMEVHSGILQAMTDQKTSLDAGIEKLEQSTTQCPEELSRIRIALEDKMEGLRSALLEIPSEAFATVKAEVLDMRLAVLDAVTQPSQTDAEKLGLEQDQKILTHMEGELKQLQSACLEAFGEQKSKLEEICSIFSSTAHSAAGADSGAGMGASLRVAISEESTQHVQHQLAEHLKAEVGDIRSILTEVIAKHNVKEDDVGREMRAKIQDGLTNMFSMVLDALTQLTALQDEVMHGIKPDQPRKAIVTSSGELIDVRAVVVEVLDQYSILKEVDEPPEAFAAVKSELSGIRSAFSELLHSRGLDSEASKGQDEAVSIVKEELSNVRSMVLEALEQLHSEHVENSRLMRSAIEEGFNNLQTGETLSRTPTLAEELGERTPGPLDLTSDVGGETTASFSSMFF